MPIVAALAVSMASCATAAELNRAALDLAPAPSQHRQPARAGHSDRGADYGRQDGRACRGLRRDGAADLNLTLIGIATGELPQHLHADQLLAGQMRRCALALAAFCVNIAFATGIRSESDVA